MTELSGLQLVATRQLQPTLPTKDQFFQQVIGYELRVQGSKV